MPVRKALTPSLTVLAVLLGSPQFGLPDAWAQIAFEEVTSEAQISYTGQSWGASWGDFDGDGRPDIYVSHHVGLPSLYVNNGDGSFTDAATPEMFENPFADTHGAAWADFDNDGDQDLLQLNGGGAGLGMDSNLLYVNAGGTLTDQAALWGIDYPLGRGRMPLWFDWDRDGLLDALVSNLVRPDGQAPSALFSQRGGVFEDDTLASGLEIDHDASFTQITGLATPDPPLILVHGLAHPQRAYRYDLQPFVDQRNSLGLGAAFPNTQDVAIADFDGDLEPDLFFARQFAASDVTLAGPSEIRAHLLGMNGEKGFEWQTDGDLVVEISPILFMPTEKIFIGAGGINPSGHNFPLFASDPSNIGIKAHTPGVDIGIYIGRDPVLPLWQVIVSRTNGPSIKISVSATDPISNLVPLGFTPSQGGVDDVLLRRAGGAFVDVTAGSGLPAESACFSVAAADFDNDMDVDLYMVCSSRALNLPNILLENLGNGTFGTVPLAGGAEGSDLGLGDTVSVADYDLDGALDLFLTNGRDLGHLSIGPDQLYRNVTNNGNHWLAVDLEGVDSNRDGIGARLLLETGGVTQIREQNGGIHRYAQDHARVHFGLGSNTQVDRLTIHWPSGRQQQIDDIPADQIIQVVEPVTPELVFCEVAMNQQSYLLGETLEIETARFANLDAVPFVTRLRLQLRFGAPFTLDLLDLGADGSLSLSPGFDNDLGPFPLFNVPPVMPQGVWSTRCALEDPASGAVQAESYAPFLVQ